MKIKIRKGEKVPEIMQLFFNRPRIEIEEKREGNYLIYIIKQGGNYAQNRKSLA